ncbi:MAG: FtsX-like permease family protein [Bacteroidia bacterium]|nr:FtsX-like permease family protein [Bacteroidia bacterium]
MYKNYFKIAWRNLRRQKLYSFINIGGLAIGLTCFILIFLYVQHELSYDRFYPDADRIYRVYQRQEGNVFLGSDYFAVTPAQLASTMMKEFLEVTSATSIQTPSALLGYRRQSYWENGIRADAHFFEVFAYSFLRGNPQTALKNPRSIVLTRSLARKIFGHQNPLGQTLSYQAFQEPELFTVTGVMEDLPTHASFKFSFIASILTDNNYVRDMSQEKWNGNSFYTFFKLADKAEPAVLEAKLPALIRKYVHYNGNVPFEDQYFIQALADLHLQTNINFDIGLKGSPRYVQLFSLIAVVVLLLACVNYTNLAIARSLKRTQEVGLRKVVGATRRQLIGQFLCESVLIAGLAFVLALGLVQPLLPVFGYLLERPIELNLTENIYVLPILLGIVLLVGMLSGSYPAFFMSSLNPVQVLKGKPGRRVAGIGVQRWLVVGQFVASIVLIISSLVIYRQFQYIQNKELGYDRAHILSIQVRDPAVRERFKVIKDEFLEQPSVLEVSATEHLPVNISSSTLIKNQEGSDLTIYQTSVDDDFLTLFDIQLIAGRNFSPDLQTDAQGKCLINETAAKALGWTPEEALGQKFNYFNGENTHTIIGVVKDFHMHALYQPIEPLMIRQIQYVNHIAVKIRPENMPQTLARLKKELAKHSAYPFEYAFMDEKFNQLYQDDRRLGEMFGFFTVLSILIASLGLFGLAAFTAEQRTKEIGIRKVLGASIKHIVTLLSRDFLRMVLVGFGLAVPVAWYLMHQWLQDFAYRVEISWWIFALAGLAALVTAFLTISYQSFKAALANPVDSLRDE